MKLYRNVMFLCLAACACTKVGSEPEISSVYTVRASVSQPECDTKVSLDQNMVKWTAGDQITVLDDNYDRYTFDLTSGDGQTSGTFNYAGSVTGNVSCAVYPAGENLKTVNVDGSGNISFVYDCSGLANQDKNYFTTNNLMVAKYSGGTLNFKNAFGILKLNYTTTDVGVGSIIVTSLNANDVLWGDATITMDSNGNITGVEMSNSDPNKNQIVRTVSTSANKTYATQMLIPDGCLEDGFAVTFFDKNDRYIRTVTAPDGNAITRSKVLNMPALTLDKKTPDQDGLDQSPSSVIIDHTHPFNTGIYPDASDCKITAVFSTPILNNPTATSGDKNGKQYVIFGVRELIGGPQLLTFATSGSASKGYNNYFYSKFDDRQLSRANDYKLLVSSPEDIVTATMTIKNEGGSYVVNCKIEKEGVAADFLSITVPELDSWNTGGKPKYPMYIGSSCYSYIEIYGDPRIYSFEYEEGGVSTYKLSGEMLSFNGIEICPVLVTNDGKYIKGKVNNNI